MAKSAPIETTSYWLPGFEPPAAKRVLLTGLPQPNLTVVEQELQRPHANESHGLRQERWNAASSWRLSAVTEASIGISDFAPIQFDQLDGLTGAVAKFDANLRAIEVLRNLDANDRQPSELERTALVRYSGWGSLPAAFNHSSSDLPWMARAEALQEILDHDDYNSALASVNNSHYTSLEVIEALWAAVYRLGFRGGRVLEPAAGVGHFVGAMPSELRHASKITAVEIDRLSGRMLQALYGRSGVAVHVAPFEKLNLPERWFDLVIGNVPFGNYKVPDSSNRPYANFSIHNYFIARSIDLVRPGGLVVLITSSHTLESTRQTARRYLASQASLLGAIRLPRGTFSASAGTDVQTDVLFLRRREGNEPLEDFWIERTQAPRRLLDQGQYQSYFPLNAWYARKPEWLIGRLRMESNGFAEIPTAVFEGELRPALDERIAMLPHSLYRPAEQHGLQVMRTTVTGAGVKPGTFRAFEGRLYQSDGAELIDVHDQFNLTQRARIIGMSEVRDQTRALLAAQLAEDDDEGLLPLRHSLNASYDQFTAKYGCLSSRANALAFRRDPDYPLLLSLEHYDEDSGTAKKAAVFSQRTLRRIAKPVAIKNPSEALAASMQWRGRVDPSYMAELLSSSPDDVVDALADASLIFHDPQDSDWKTADDYLSGNVRVKLDQAKAAGPEYRRNYEALQRVQPEELPPASIEVRLGAVWVPAADVEAFVLEVLELKDCKVQHSPQAGAWSVDCSDWSIHQSVKATQEFGTPRMHAVALILCALNVQTPTVRDRLPDSTAYVVNPQETLAAREKLGLLKERFARWAFEDQSRRERLCALYNRLFNSTRPRTYDGSHLLLPGFSQCYPLHPHQPNAVWRIVQAGNTGIFHTVGAGKTAVCTIASMELRRLGFASKPCHVVPNHMLQSYTAEFVRLYPQASVLMATKEDLAGDRRRELISRIATGDWDAIVITHSSFERIKMKPTFTEGFIKEVVYDIELAIRAAKNDSSSNRIVKQLELMKKNWASRLESLSAQSKKDDLLTWEELGIDWLFVDEAHLHKNLFRFSKMRVAGLPMASSERAFDLYLKTRYTMQVHGNRQRGIVFATATPVANTMAEIHTMQRYLQPNRLAELGLEQFDAWAATFGEAVTALEISPDGGGYRMNTRFARFINIPELMSIFGEVADIQTREMLKLPVPKLRGSKARVVTCPAKASLKAFVQTLVARASAIRNGHVRPDEDNMLSVTTDGRKAALDFRLISPTAPFDSSGKVAACVQEVCAVWKRTVDQRSTQLIFCDLSSPKGGRSFSVYDDLRMRLIDAGIPKHEIAFIHDSETDAQKAKLFQAVRSGQIRILLGSTQKMGLGTNVQDRLIAQHELDAPWRPCDVEQREGRILRQRNMNDEVEIFRYVTEGSFDAYSWQTLETKAKFIAQVMRGDQGIRSVEDVTLAALSYAEVKALASGNPLVIEKAGIDAEVAKLSTLHWMWRNQRYNNEREIAELPSLVESLQRRLDAHKADQTAVQPMQMQNVSLQLGKTKIVGAEAAGEALRACVLRIKDELAPSRGTVERIVGRFGGLELGLLKSDQLEVPAFFLAGRMIYNAEPYQTGPALVNSLLSALHLVGEMVARIEAQLALRQKRLADLEVEMARPFEHELRLTELSGRQAALMAQLDLNKDEAGNQSADAEANASLATA